MIEFFIFCSNDYGCFLSIFCLKSSASVNLEHLSESFICKDKEI